MHPEFVETPLFTRQADRLLSIGSRETVADLLVDSMYAGAVVPHSGGLRKVRLPMIGRGKRGGLRLIYAIRRGGDRVYLLCLYAKSETDSLTQAQMRALGRAVDE